MSSLQAREELNEKYFYERICSVYNSDQYVKHIYDKSLLDRIPKGKKALMRSHISSNHSTACEMWDNPHLTLYSKAPPLWEEDFETTFHKRTEFILNVIKADLTCVLMSMEDVGFPCDAPIFRVGLTMGLEEQFIKLFNMGGFDIMLDDSVASFSIQKAFVSRRNKEGKGEIEELSQTHCLTDILNNVISIVKFRREVDSNE